MLMKCHATGLHVLPYLEPSIAPTNKYRGRPPSPAGGLTYAHMRVIHSKYGVDDTAMELCQAYQYVADYTAQVRAHTCT